MTKRRILLKIEIFVLIFAVILGSVTFVMRNKNLSLRRTMAPFYKEPKSSLDIVFFGSSHVMNAIIPMDLYKNYGIANYNYAHNGADFLTIDKSLQEVLKYQKPKLIIVDLYSLPYGYREWKIERPWAHLVFDNFNFSLNRIILIDKYCKEYDDNNTFDIKWELTFPLYFYHSNWTILKKSDFYNPLLTGKGFNLNIKKTKSIKPNIPINKDDISKLKKCNVSTFWEIINLCKENNIKLLFTLIPYTHKNGNLYEMKYFNEVEYLVKSIPNVEYLNLFHRLDEIGFDFSTDLADFGHVNPSGAQKITTHIGKYIKEHYDIPDRRLDPAYAKWNDDYKLYVQDTFAQELNATKNSEKYLELLTSKKEATDNTCIFFVKTSEKNINSKHFNSLGINVNSNNCITIIDEGKIVYNRTASDILLQHEYKIGRLPIKLVSDVKGKNSSIKVDGIEQIKNKSGITVVIYDKLLKKVSSVRSL